MQWNLARDILVTLAIKWIGLHNFTPHLSYVSTLPDITQKPKSYVVPLLIMWVALKRTGFGVSEVALKSLFLWLNHSRCSKWRPFAFTHAHSRVCHWQWLRWWCPEQGAPSFSTLIFHDQKWKSMTYRHNIYFQVNDIRLMNAYQN